VLSDTNPATLLMCGDVMTGRGVDQILDYEGIAGYEEFRNQLVLAFFLAMDRDTGRLVHLEMAPFEIKRFQLRCTAAQDTSG